MSHFIYQETGIEDLIIIKPKIYIDNRGYFLENYRAMNNKRLGKRLNFIQDNQSCSKRGVLRGMHFQERYPQDKLVSVSYGKILDVAVDLRKNSMTYGKYFSVELSHENGYQLFVPKGFAHGFLSITDNTIVSYKCSEYYKGDDQCGFRWDSKKIDIEWKLAHYGLKQCDLIISEKDCELPEIELNNGYFKFNEV